MACDIVCVVDVSGSMGTEATMKNEKGNTECYGLTILDIVKHAVKTIIHNLEYYDRIALVAFSDKAEIVFGLTSMDEEGKNKANLALESLKEGG